ncbi:hypothetical protein OS493_031938 [Desmophyllum pertusum]|uniref:Uncharacterized protein n=1 Tax=Desmophyllum pertusum TaxID=174260 RepID=A0A9W9ZWY7_9CNID|nr:hypothetical protein OS493_031938 [Desmophyllum pertusum]
MDKEEDVASGKDEHQSDEIQDRPNSNDSEIDRNLGEDDAVKPGFQMIATIAVATIAAILAITGFHIIAKIAAIIAVATIAAIIWKPGSRGEPSNAITCPYNIEIINASNVAIGDHNAITVPPLVRQLGQRMNTLRISKGFQAMMETGDRESVDEETHNSSQPVNIIVRDSDIVAIGDKIEIQIQNSDEMFTQRQPDREPRRSIKFGVQVVLLRGLHLRSELRQLPAPGVDPRAREVLNKMREIVNQLYPLRDCGNGRKLAMP